MSGFTLSLVMPALGAGIHDFILGRKVVDGRAEPGHDGVPHAATPEPTP